MPKYHFRFDFEVEETDYPAALDKLREALKTANWDDMKSEAYMNDNVKRIIVPGLSDWK